MNRCLNHMTSMTVMPINGRKTSSPEKSDSLKTGFREEYIIKGCNV